MKLNKGILLITVAAVAVQAVADQQESAYWMKKYPDADKSKVARCLAVADTAYVASLKGGMDGVSWAVLAKGTAWESCMEGK